jgi:hypothetical protein
MGASTIADQPSVVENLHPIGAESPECSEANEDLQRKAGPMQQKIERLCPYFFIYLPR